jgi:hypothetical protein
MERAYNKSGIHHGSVCPHCGAHIGPAVPMGRMLLIFFVGGVVILEGASYFRLSEPVEFVVALVWLACVVGWYSRHPLIVLPEDFNPYKL